MMSTRTHAAGGLAQKLQAVLYIQMTCLVLTMIRNVAGVILISRGIHDGRCRDCEMEEKIMSCKMMLIRAERRCVRGSLPSGTRPNSPNPINVSAAGQGRTDVV